MRRALHILAVAALAGALFACFTDEIVSLDPEQAPGQSPPTLEVRLGPDDLESWIDSVFAGFSGAGNALFVRVEESAELSSRGLVRFNSISDSVFVVDTVSGALSLDSARVVFSVDTALTRIAEGGTTVQLRAVEEEWDVGSATWEFAVDSPAVAIRWSAPGGAYGPVLDEIEVTELTDSIVFSLGAASDSILRSWLDTAQVNTGLAVVVADSGLLYLQLPRLRYEVVPEVAPDTTIELVTGAVGTDRTFLFEPTEAPPAPGVVRLGGVNGWRVYVEMTIPDTVSVAGSAEPQPLRGSTISLAEVILISRDPPDPPFAAERDFLVAAVELVDDFRIFGGKTPVGPSVENSDFVAGPDSLASGSAVAANVTALIQAWADAPPESALPVRIALRAVPEASTFGFWELGAADGDPSFRPVLRIVFTAPTQFPIP